MRVVTRAWLLAVCAAVASACGTGPPAHGAAAATASAAAAPSASATGIGGCLPPALGSARTIPDPGGGTLSIGVLGSGPRAVILSNESDQDACSWLPFAQRLATAGYRVLVWDYGGNLPPDELRALAGWLRAHGGRRIVLMGASEGAKASLVAAARLGRRIRGVVSLSAESVLQPRIVVAPYVARLHCPLLLVTAVSDPYGSQQAAREFMRAAKGSKRLITVPGADHGTALLSGPAAATVVPAVFSFIRRVAR